ncbi:TolC family protein [Mucilaginibacter sp. OK283]|uniref:TolC family protein n=1 Tax=Mucilaginibacter sp. OK283 TaxID=1881049 RepID=UPI0008C1DB2A|nr:TolC family protein [Mucilaginibacter sp. OK283]SEP40407.1 Outer membrane protein TolC [Mucilaginibacter sp. OK283]
MKNKAFQLLCLLPVFIMLTRSARAQQVMSLEQCIDTALRQSLQLRADNYDLEKTKAGVQQQYSALLPNINGSASYQYSFQVQTSVIPAEAFGGPVGTYSAVKFGVPQTKNAQITLNQTIFNPSVTIGLKAAKLAVNLNQLQIQSSKEDLVYNLSATYYNIQSVLKQIELSNETLNNTESLLASMQQQLKAGLATQTDVDRLTVTRDNDKASLQSLANNREKYYNLLKTLMNLPLVTSITVVPFTDNEASNALLQTPTFNPDSKTNYRQIMENINISKLERQNIKAGYLPNLSLNGGYGLYGNYTNADPFKSINGKYYPSSYVGLKLTIPIFDGFSIRYQAKQKDFEIKKYEVQAQQTIQQNNKELADAYEDLKSNFITYQNQQRNLALAQKVMRDIDTQYKSGLVKVSDFINASSDLHTAQNNFVNALINIKQAELNLKKTQGTLLKN